jgi:hypothetical protein
MRINTTAHQLPNLHTFTTNASHKIGCHPNCHNNFKIRIDTCSRSFSNPGLPTGATTDQWQKTCQQQQETCQPDLP